MDSFIIIYKQAKDTLNNSHARAAKTGAKQDYTMADKVVKKSIKNDKKQFIYNIATQAEVAAAQHNMKELHDTTRKLAGKCKNPDEPILDNEGEILTKQEDQLSGWAGHFRDILNRPKQMELANIPPAVHPLMVITNMPNKQ